MLCLDIALHIWTPPAAMDECAGAENTAAYEVCTTQEDPIVLDAAQKCTDYHVQHVFFIILAPKVLLYVFPIRDGQDKQRKI